MNEGEPILSLQRRESQFLAAPFPVGLAASLIRLVNSVSQFHCLNLSVGFIASLLNYFLHQMELLHLIRYSLTGEEIH